jgi:hypothetical protein
MVRKAVHTLPVDWFWAVVANNVGCVTKDVELGVTVSTDHLVTGCTETYWRNACVCLSSYCSVTESTVKAKTFHRLPVSRDMVELLQ